MWLYCLADDPQGIAPAGRFQVPHHRRGPRHPWLDENSAEAFCCEIKKKKLQLWYLFCLLNLQITGLHKILQANRCRNRLFMDLSSSCNRHVNFVQVNEHSTVVESFQARPSGHTNLLTWAGLMIHGTVRIETHAHRDRDSHMIMIYTYWFKFGHGRVSDSIKILQNVFVLYSIVFLVHSLTHFFLNKTGHVEFETHPPTQTHLDNIIYLSFNWSIHPLQMYKPPFHLLQNWFGGNLDGW